jgi:aspartate aminotransferase-like enzyme
MFETGHFASLWQKMATRLGLQAEVLRTRVTTRCCRMPQAGAGACRPT